MVSIKPIGNANKTAPNSASERCNWACMCGIRDTHEEYPKPETKKNTVLAILNPFGEFWILLKKGRIIICEIYLAANLGLFNQILFF
jgi:hypothetical protein